MIMGTSNGYGGTLTSPSNTPRGFIGSVTFTPSVPCAGTPAPGNTITNSAAACSGGTINLSLQNTTSGTGVTYQWQTASSSTGPWSNVAGTAATYSPVITSAAWYRANVTCSGNTGTSNPVGVTLNPFTS